MIYVLYVILALLWGLSYLASKILLDFMAPLEVLAVRWTVALITFLILIAVRVVKVNFSGKKLKYLLILVAVQPCTYALLETWGLDFTTSSETSIFVAVAPLMVVVEGAIFLRQKISGKVLFAICLSFAGVLICILFAPGFQTGSQLIGYVILVVTVIVGAAYTLISNHISSMFSSMEITFAMAIGGSIFFNLLSFGAGNGIHPYQVLFSSWTVVGAILFVGVGCSCVAYMIFNYTLSKNIAAIAVTIQTNSVSLVGVLAGIIIGGDPWGLYTVVGLALALTGIFISSMEGRGQDGQKGKSVKRISADT